MKEISQTRLLLSQLHRLHGPVNEFYKQQVMRISSVNSLAELESVKYYLGDKFFPAVEIEQLSGLWPASIPLAQDISYELKQVKTIHEELLLCRDILIFDELLMQFKSLYSRYIADSHALIELLKSD